MQFLQPVSIPDALAALGEYGDDAKVIAGGTAVTLMLQQQLIAPEVLVSLGRVPGLADIRVDSSGLHLGPLVILRDIAHAPEVQQRWPALAAACGVVGNVRVRNQATIGGNLAEADYASDPPAVLLALDASVTATGAAGARTIPLADFFFGFFTTALEPDELITEVFVPSPPAGARMTYLKYRSRSSEDRPCVGVAAMLATAGGVCADLRVAVGAACEVPSRLTEAEALAAGKPLDEALIVKIAAAYADQIETLDDLRGSAWYRTQMVRVHVQRALLGVRDGRR